MRILMQWIFVVTLLCTAHSPVAQDAQPDKEAPQPVLVAGPVALRYAEIEVRAPVVEMVPDMYLLEPDMDTLYDLVERIELAGRDDSIHGVIIRLRGWGGGWGKAQEFRQAIHRCRKAGKDVICFMQSGGNIEYYLASSCERVFMPPTGALFLTGLRAEVLFLKGLLDKVGLQGDMVQIGESKGAAEPLTRTTGSPAFRESIETLLDDYYRQLVEGIASGRNVGEDEVKALIDRGPFTARRAKEAGLIEDRIFYDEVLGGLKERHGRNVVVVPHYWKRRRSAAPRGSGLQQLMKMFLGTGPVSPRPKRPAGPAIAVLYAVGPLVLGDPDGIIIGEPVVSAERMVKLIRTARDDNNIRAIVLRVDSPGGSALASDMIWHELRRADEDKPVVVSLSDVAGSGGYYIAAGGRKIYANAATITGSIGVVGGKLVIKGLFDKVGLTVDVFQRGKNAGLFSSVEAFSEEQRELLRETLQETYEIFLDRIVDSRKQPLEQIEKMARGRAWTGHLAQRGKLVDEIGGLSDAIAGARKEAGIEEDARVVILRMPEPRSLWEAIIFGPDGGARMPRGLMLHQLPPALRPACSYLNALSCLQDEHAVALMPGFISIK